VVEHPDHIGEAAAFDSCSAYQSSGETPLATLGRGSDPMEILFLAHRLPVPPTKGERIRAYHQLCYLARRHTIDLACFADDSDGIRYLGDLSDVCREVYVEPLTRSQRLSRAARAMATGEAISLATFHSRAFAARTRAWQEQRPYGAVIAYSGAMARYLVARPGRRLIMDLVDVDSAKWEQYAGEAHGPRRWLFAREGRRVAAAERSIAAHVDCATLVSEPEAALFRSRVPGGCPVVAVANGVDERFFDAGWRPPAAKEPTLCFMGAMDYRPNVDAVLWFAREVLPRVRDAFPGVILRVIGGHATTPLRRLAARGALTLAGYVPDVLPELAAAHLFVAPLRIARGVQNKVLQALAFGMPVVATPQALEGIDARPGYHLAVADTAERFAEAILTYLRDPARAWSAGAAARRHIGRRYRWEQTLDPLDAALAQTTSVGAA